MSRADSNFVILSRITCILLLIWISHHNFYAMKHMILLSKISFSSVLHSAFIMEPFLLRDSACILIYFMNKHSQKIIFAWVKCNLHANLYWNCAYNMFNTCSAWLRTIFDGYCVWYTVPNISMHAFSTYDNKNCKNMLKIMRYLIIIRLYNTAPNLNHKGFGKKNIKVNK